MYLITIRSRLNPRSKLAANYRDVGGAYVLCYISFKDFTAAEHLARWAIRREGWIPEKRTDARIVTRKHFKTKKQKQYYSDILKYGYSLVFSMWSADAPDNDANHDGKRKQRNCPCFYGAIQQIVGPEPREA